MPKGIDYGLGRTNIDRATGIRYGVISQHAISGDSLNELESVYAGPNCPRCGNDAIDLSTVDDEVDRDDYDHGYGCHDYGCDSCRYTFDSSEAWSEDPIGHKYDGDGYAIESCLDSDLMVLASPFYTRGVFCSPCVPGAVSLESPDNDGDRAYCLSHDWFEDGRAPYPVYRVADDTVVEPDA